MKTKIIIIAAFILVLTHVVNAQNAKGGITGGVSTESLRISEVGDGFTRVLKGDGITGYEAGLFGKFGIGPFYVKPAVLLHQSKGKFDSYIDGEQSGSVTFSVNSIEAPVLGGMNLIGPVGIEVGPVYHFISQIRDHTNGSNLALDQQSKIGYKAGFALNLGSLILSTHYQGMSKTNDSGKTTLSSPSRLTFGAAMSIGGNGDK